MKKFRFKTETLELIKNFNIEDSYYLQKAFDWQKEYDWIDFEEFIEYYTKCSRCNSYEKGSCICYAR